jgi:hypothetical protein
LKGHMATFRSCVEVPRLIFFRPYYLITR